jgi:hypothetical protein
MRYTRYTIRHAINCAVHQVLNIYTWTLRKLAHKTNGINQKRVYFSLQNQSVASVIVIT